jgi:glycerophosphoryl diester phosphodiesterase
VDWVHGLGKHIYAYTCNDPATIRKMTAAGVDAILTDHPGWLAAEFAGTKNRRAVCPPGTNGSPA